MEINVFKETLENTEGAIKKGQSRETGNIVYTINVREYRRGNQKRTIQRNWQHSVHNKR
jgi:hypothetical protein